MEEHWVTEGLGRRSKDEQSTVEGKLLDALDEAPLDLVRHRPTTRYSKPTGEIPSVPCARQLDERERVTATLSDDLVTDSRVERPAHVFEQQRSRVAFTEARYVQRRQPDEQVIAKAGPNRESEHHAFSQQTASDELEDLPRRLVEPMGIVDDADQRPLFRDVGEERQGREPDEKTIRHAPSGQAKDGRERVALRRWKPLEAMEQWRAKLLEAAVGELYLGFDAARGRNVFAAGAIA